MKARSYLILFGSLLLIVIVAGVTWKLLRPSEPVYGGRKLTQWLSDLDANSPSYSPRAETNAIIAVRQIGPRAIPPLLKMLQARDSAPKRKLMELAAMQPFFRISLSEWEMRRQALHGFHALGALGSSAIPELSRIVEKSHTFNERTEYAIICLWFTGPDAVPTLIKFLTNSNPRVQTLAVNALGELGSVARPAIPALLLRIKSPNQGNAIRVLGETGDDSLIPLFSQLLLNTNTASDAAFALARLGPKGIPPLMLALTNAEKQIRISAFVALEPSFPQPVRAEKTMGGDPGFAIRCILYNFQIRDAEFREQAVSNRFVNALPGSLF